MSEPRFDLDDVFEPDDYMYFYEEIVGDETSDADAAQAWRLLGLEPGMRVLDLACGHGRIANRLAESGAVVTGLDRSERFLELAREDAFRRGVEVEYVLGDMRDLPWEARFDRALSWFTSWGYFDDDADNRRVLSQVRKALVPGGTLVIEHQNRDRNVGDLQTWWVTERGDDFMIDRHELDLVASRILTERTVIRAGHVRRFRFFVRMLAPSELSSWLTEAGFAEVRFTDREGEPLTIGSRRMVAIASNR